MEEGDSQVLVCALAALDRRIALGEQLMVGFGNLGRRAIPFFKKRYRVAAMCHNRCPIVTRSLSLASVSSTLDPRHLTLAPL